MSPLTQINTQDKNHILLIRTQTNSFINELYFRRALEEQGCIVSTIVDNDKYTPKLIKAGSTTYLDAEGKETDVSKEASESKEFRDLLEERMRYPKGGLVVEKRDGKFYIIYPSVKEDIKNIHGVSAEAVFPTHKQLERPVLPIQKQLEVAGVVPMNNTEAIEISISKIKSQECFEKAGVPTPHTVCFPAQHGYNEEKCKAAIEQIGLPVMIKGEHGAGGNQVHPANTVEEALGLVRKIIESGDGVLIQEKIPIPPDRLRQGLRVLVLDGEIIGAVFGYRKLDKQLVLEPWMDKITPLQKEYAIKAANSVGQYFAGIDMLDTPDGRTVVLETNSDSGIKSHEHFGENIASKMASGFNSRITQKRGTGQSCFTLFRLRNCLEAR